MDTLPIALTAVCQQVEAIQVLRIQDAATRRLPLQRKIGAGLSVAEFHERVRAGTVRHVGLAESVHAIAQAIGWKIGSLADQIEPVLAERETSSREIAVATGHVLGVRQVIRGYVDEQLKITLELEMYLGAPRPHDHIVIEGTPRVDVTVNEGTHGDLATAAILVNAIPSLLDSEPGLRVMSDLPVVHYRLPTASSPGGRDEGSPRRPLAF
jgi:4-hydroxy-tetrahydrodipicolinate reductase